MIYGVNAFSSVSFWDRYKVQRGSRIRREVLHTLQFRCACTIQCLYNTMMKWEGTEEEARKAQDGWYRRKGNENGRSSITCWWSSYTRWSFKKCKRILRAWVTISLPSFFLVPSPLFFILYSRDIVNVNVNDNRDDNGDADDGDEQPAHTVETMKMQANPPWIDFSGRISERDRETGGREKERRREL